MAALQLSCVDMNNSGFSRKLRHGLAFFMGALALAIAALWGDSYRVRIDWDEPLSADQESMINSFKEDPGSLRMFPRGTGLDYSYQVDLHAWYRVCTNVGELILLSEAGYLTHAPVPPEIDDSCFGFGYKRYIWRRGSIGGQDGRPSIHADFRTDRLTIPFWALFVACAIWPTMCIVRGPLRRRRRRNRGQCVKCGYDLSGSTARCPECSAAHSCAFDSSS